MNIMSKIKVLMMAITAMFLTISLASCGQSSQSGDYERLVDGFGEIFLLQDGDSAAFDEALAAVGRFLEDDTLLNLKDAENAVEACLEQFSQISSTYESPATDAAFDNILKAYGIEPEEFRIEADMRVSSALQYMDSLNMLAVYLDYENRNTLGRDAFVFLYEQTVRIQEYSRRFSYYGINYYFAGLEGTALDYAREQVITQLRSFYFEDLAWETDRDVIEAKGLAYLNQMEAEQEKVSEEIGRQQKKLDELQ